MKLRSTLAAAAGILGLGAGTLLASGPALAAPGCTGSNCTTTGTVQVAATISASIDNTSFAFNGGNAVPAGTYVGPMENPGGGCAWYTGASALNLGTLNGGQVNCPNFTVSISTADSAGYQLEASGTPFTKTGGITFPLSALQLWTVQGSFTQHAPQPISLTGTPTAVGGEGGSTAGTNWPWLAAINPVPASAPQGNFTTVLTFLAQAN